MMLMMMIMLMNMMLMMLMMMMMMRRPSSLRVRAKPRHLPYIYIEREREKKYIYDVYMYVRVCYVVWTFSLPPSSFQSSAASCGTRLSRFNKIQGNSLSGLFKPLQRVGHSLSQRWLRDTSFCHVLSTVPNFAGASGHVCRRKHRFETCWTESCKIPHY